MLLVLRSKLRRKLQARPRKPNQRCPTNASRKRNDHGQQRACPKSAREHKTEAGVRPGSTATNQATGRTLSRHDEESLADVDRPRPVRLYANCVEHTTTQGARVLLVGHAKYMRVPGA